jgi:lipopolysaccharide transport system ATP-binding protein
MVRGRHIVLGDSIEEFWALKDVSFEIKLSEIVGIIGRGRALITEPTEARTTINGWVSSLLEVGTGFSLGTDRPREYLFERHGLLRGILP